MTIIIIYFDLYLYQWINNYYKDKSINSALIQSTIIT